MRTSTPLEPCAGVWTLESATYTDWVYSPEFSSEECEEIIKLGAATDKQSASINKSASEPNVRDSDYRRSELSWLFPNENTAWLFQKLTAAVQGLNQEFFNFDLYGFVEGLQFTTYKGTDSGCYGKHIDITPSGPTRKLSVVVQLSDPNTYEGGELLIHTTKTPAAPSKARGVLVAFPSYSLHEVTPVTSGTRYSLVAWVTGKPFR